MTAPALLIAAPRSGSGKTTVTLALLAALRQRGLTVRAAKTGPDYIDPAFHEAATGAPCFNLDSWAMPPDLLGDLLARSSDADVLVIEAAMGLFDGVAGAPGRTGASADIAARFGLPVVLVLDVSGQSQTAAASLRGFIGFRPGVTIAGVILNRVGSAKHRDGITAAIAELGIPVLGALPRQPTLALPERHLGLVQAEEQGDLAAFFNRLTVISNEHLDIKKLLEIATPPRGATRGGISLRPPGQNIALARDAAFSFVYPHLLKGWRAANATIRLFSPLADEAPPEDCDVCWLPGGYPELHAGPLAAAATFRAGMARFAETRPVHGECGGYMALGQGLVDAAGQRHRMLGLLGHATSFAKRRMSLGYRHATLASGSVLGAPGTMLRGHEFHYATVEDPGADPPLAWMQDGRGAELGAAGGVRGRVAGSFFHVLSPA